MSSRADDLVEEAAQVSRRKPFFAALRFANFRFFWIGLICSNVGNWMQLTALSYLVVRLAPSAQAAALWLAYLALAQALPAVLFAPIGSVVAEVFPRRTVLWNTNAVMAMCAAFFALMVEQNAVNLLAICLVSIVYSATRAIDAPARQSWVPELVDTDYQSNALGLNALAINAPSIVGPTLAALLIAGFDASLVFIANALLTLAVVGAVSVMTPARRPLRARARFTAALVEGLNFLLMHRTLRVIVCGLALGAFFVRPYVTLLPALALDEYRTNVFGLGMLYAAGGVGSVCGAMGSAYLGNVPHRIRIWGAAGMILGLSAVFLGAAASVLDAIPWIFLAGATTLVFVGSSNIFMHTLVPERLRGRAVAVYSLLVLACVPFGAVLFGIVAMKNDLRIAYEAGGFLFCAIIALIQIFFV